MGTSSTSSRLSDGTTSIGEAPMALNYRMAPGSIRSVDDLIVALECVLADVFFGVGSMQGRSRNPIEFLIRDDPAVGDYGTSFRITVVDVPEEADPAISRAWAAQ
jgi:hypothetical protein